MWRKETVEQRGNVGYGGSTWSLGLVMTLLKDETRELGAAEAATDCASELWILALRTNTWVLRFAQDDTVSSMTRS